MNSTWDKVESLERDIDLIRNNVGELVGELNQRRHDAFDLRLQFHRHARGFVVFAAAFLCAVAGVIALAISRRRHHRSLTGRARRLGRAARGFRAAVGRAVSHPDRVAERGPSVTRKVAAAGGAAMASVLGKKLARRLVSET
jgi:hypothetical protein